MPIRLVLLLALLAPFVPVGDVAAQNFDHLKCYRARGDFAPEAHNYTLDVLAEDPRFPVEQGCHLRPISREICIDVEKTNVTPTPPGAPAGPGGQAYLCYKIKCPKFTSTITVTDQFGVHQLRIRKPARLCTPLLGGETPSTTTTTTTEAPTTTTTETSTTTTEAPNTVTSTTTTTTTTAPLCGNGALDQGEAKTGIWLGFCNPGG